MRTEEQMRFQGIDPTSFKKDVTEPELQKQIGNAMSLCVIERLLNKVIAAAGFLNQERPDRWENGEAVKELEDSKDKGFLQDEDENPTNEREQTELGEIHYWNKNQVFRFYRLPNRWTWLKWENVRRVIHKCGSTGETLFDEEVNDETRNELYFWESRCVAPGGIMSIFLYDKPDDDEYWMKTRKTIQTQKRKSH